MLPSPALTYDTTCSDNHATRHVQREGEHLGAGAAQSERHTVMHGGTICDGRHGEPLSGDCRARFVTPERTESEKRHSRPRVARVVKGSMPQAHAPLHSVCAARVAAPPPHHHRSPKLLSLLHHLLQELNLLAQLANLLAHLVDAGKHVVDASDRAEEHVGL